jgi:O-methyltransferase
MSETKSSRYIDLLQIVLTRYNLNSNFGEHIPVDAIITRTGWKFYLKFKLVLLLNYLLSFKKLSLTTFLSSEKLKDDRIEGISWPAEAETMVGLKRLKNVTELVYKIIKDNVEGDFVETGVWRGGVSILIQGILIENELDELKKVYVCDSFQGLPAQTSTIDRQASMNNAHFLEVSLEKVKSNFSKYNLLKNNVVFVQGWFNQTLPNLKADKISLLRVDADFYESTLDVLNNLYNKVSTGGYVIIDDYMIDGCHQAVDEFRLKNMIDSPLVKIDWTGVYWQKI